MYKYIDWSSCINEFHLCNKPVIYTALYIYFTSLLGGGCILYMLWSGISSLHYLCTSVSKCTYYIHVSEGVHVCTIYVYCYINVLHTEHLIYTKEKTGTLITNSLRQNPNRSNQYLDSCMYLLICALNCVEHLKITII